MPKTITRRHLLTTASAAALALSFTPATKAQNLDVRQGKRVTLLHFTDSHAQLETHLDYLPGAVPQFQMMGGFARLKTAIDLEKSRGKGPYFVLDGGDDFQGSGPAAWSKGAAILEPLKAMGLDVFTPGNWEPAYGPEIFKDTMAKLGCPVVCYNLTDTDTGKGLYPASVILERNGVRMAVVGITDIGASKRQPPDEWRGMDTSRMAGLREYVQDLRAREKPDLVVALTHTGLTIARSIARKMPEFDVILSGHTHERTSRPIIEGNVLVVEPGAFGSWLGRLDLVLKPGGGIAAHEFQLIPVLANRYAEDPAVKSLVDASLKPHRERMARELGKTDTVLMRYDVLETSADDFVSDAIKAVSGADIGLTNGFRFGVPVNLSITEAALWNILPMDARMKKGWVTGKELRDYWEDELEMVYSKSPMKLNGGWGPRASGMDIVFDAHAEHGHRVISIKVGNKDIADDGHYTIAGCEREGEPVDVICRHRNTHDAEILPFSIHEALSQYLKSNPVISPKPDGREKARDLPARVLSQDAVLAGGKLDDAPTTPEGLPPIPDGFSRG
ncbi:bifunctional UDP-sugar hydrolase/5'-nucleotidase [Bradyrhizobium sp.]|uniref:bifunctional metallophosphatase/5'-nucleotidase n=1 Tax=Bradyrhizobium sp. TaxID=376 RepID=UPI00239E846D|nr:bifunctional metallophosphatase/5'-nucleotidase [Bradyrhizobium sp.]MDE1932694.1 5'-nucleotidase C-terminal domain-containing protein [Bradyrhizobium sp.]